MERRNTKPNFDFFRLDTGFFANNKIKALRRQFGSVGILTYLYILSGSYGNNGYYIRIKSIEEFAYDIAESISNSNLTKTASVATDCINYLASRGEIDKQLLDRGLISGKSIQCQYIEMCLASKRKIEINEEYLLVDIHDYPFAKITLTAEDKTLNTEDKTLNTEDSTISKSNSNSKSISNDIHVSKKVREEKDINNKQTCMHACAYDEIFEDFGVSREVKEGLVEFIKYLKASYKIVMLNSRLEDLIVRLDFKYGNDEMSKVKEIQQAIINGYKRLECENVK